MDKIKVYSELQTAILKYAVKHNLRGGAFGHQPVRRLAFWLAELLADKPDIKFEEAVDYAFSTYGRNDEEFWEAVQEDDTSENVTALVDRIVEGIERLRRNTKLVSFGGTDPTASAGRRRKGT